jgi:hypothetical protein
MVIQVSPYPDGYALNPQQGGTGIQADQAAPGKVLVTTGDPAAPYSLTSYPPAVAPSVSACYLQQQYPSGTNAGGALVGGAWNVRQLNTVVANNIVGAVYDAANYAMSLPAGTYVVSASASINGANNVQIGIYDYISSAFLLTGDSLYGMAADASNFYSCVNSGMIVAASPIKIGIQQCINGASSATRLGYNAGSGSPEVYAQLSVLKLS